MRFLLELSLRDTNTRTTTHAIAQSQDLSEKYLESIASKLRSCGFIASTKGAGGGYTLAKDPSCVTVGEVMRAMETTFFEIHCSDTPCTACAEAPRCALTDLFGRVHDTLSDLLDSMTLADMRERYQLADAQK